MTRIIAICNQKGGVAKTTTTANLGAGLAIEGKKVLLLDMDPQAALTYTFFDDDAIHLGEGTVYDFLAHGEMAALTAVGGFGSLDLLPANIELAGAEMSLQGGPGRDFLLKRAFKRHGARIQGYDYILIDCPPTLGLLSINALAAADSVLIPVTSEGLPLIGLSMLLETMEVIKDRLNPYLAVEGLLVTRHKSRTNLSREVFEELAKDFGDKLYKTRISENIALAEAPMKHKTIYDHAPGSVGSMNYTDLVLEFLERNQSREVAAEVYG